MTQVPNTQLAANKLPKAHPTDHGRVAYLDGLRAIAVLGVVFCHTAEVYAIPAPWNYFLVQGQHGVDLFFVLSGFCLSYPALHGVHTGARQLFDISRFAANRIVRITPPYWIAIIVSAVLSLFAGPRATVSEAIRDFLFVDGGRVHHVNDAFWTIPIEMRWYIVFPILLWLFTRRPVLFAIVALLAFGSAFTAARSTDLFILPSFMLGIFAAWITLTKSVRGAYATIAALIFLAFAMHPAIEALASEWQIRNPIWYAASFCIVLACGRNRFLEKIVSLKMLTTIGLISYSVYLLHMPILYICHSRGIPAWAGALFEIAASSVFWFVVERPFLIGETKAAIIRRLLVYIETAFSRIGLPKLVSLADLSSPNVVPAITHARDRIESDAVASPRRAAG